MQPFIVVSDPRSHHRRCGLDPTAVSPAPPFSQVFAFDPPRERRVRAVAARQSLGASQLRMLGKWRRDTHGDHAIALREVIFAYSLPQVRLLMLLLIGGYFAIKISAVSRVSVRFLTVASPSRVKYADGPSTTPHGSDNCKEWSKRLLRTAPSSTGRGHCRVTPLSRRCRVLW
jgi:hypothetical protein